MYIHVHVYIIHFSLDFSSMSDPLNNEYVKKAIKKNGQGILVIKN